MLVAKNKGGQLAGRPRTIRTDLMIFQQPLEVELQRELDLPRVVGAVFRRGNLPKG